MSRQNVSGTLVMVEGDPESIRRAKRILEMQEIKKTIEWANKPLGGGFMWRSKDHAERRSHRDYAERRLKKARMGEDPGPDFNQKERSLKRDLQEDWKEYESLERWSKDKKPEKLSPAISKAWDEEMADVKRRFEAKKAELRVKEKDLAAHLGHSDFYRSVTNHFPGSFMEHLQKKRPNLFPKPIKETKVFEMGREFFNEVVRASGTWGSSTQWKLYGMPYDRSFNSWNYSWTTKNKFASKEEQLKKFNEAMEKLVGKKNYTMTADRFDASKYNLSFSPEVMTTMVFDAEYGESDSD